MLVFSEFSCYNVCIKLKELTMNIKVTDSDLYFAKIREGAVIPSKKNEDAGYDVYACFDGDYFVIESGETKAIPTGIATAFSSKYYAQIEERSSMAKLGIKKSGGVIDSGYRGEYFIMTYNTNKKPFVISKVSLDDVPETIEVDGKTYNRGDVILYPATKAICEIVMQIIPDLEVKELSYDDLLTISSSRGTGAFGSSNK